MAVTYAQLAERLAVSRGTIRNYIERLHLEDHRTKEGAAWILDDYAASAIADAVGPKPAQERAEEDQQEDRLTQRIRELEDEAKELRELLGGAQRLTERLQGNLEEKDREIRRKDDELREGREELERVKDELREYQTATRVMLEAGPVQRLRGFRRFKGLLPEATGK